MKKINVRKAIKTVIGAIAVFQIGELAGGYKSLKRINEDGFDSETVKTGLDAAKQIDTTLKSVKDDLKRHFGLNSSKPIYDEDDFCDEEDIAEEEPAVEETADVVEEATDQPED